MAGQYLRHLRLPVLRAQPLKVSLNYNPPKVLCLNHRILHTTQIDQTMPLPQGSSKDALQLRLSDFTQRRYDHSTPFMDGKEFTAFYYFPYIASMKFFSRLKLVQTVVTVSLVPGLYFVEYYGIIQPVDKSLTVVLATLALSMLYALGEFFRRLIGIMYLNRDHSLVKLSHLTFWGRRKDLIVPVSDIIPLQECGEHKDTIAKLRRYSTNKYLLFSTRFGRILNKGMFEVVFGSFYQDQPES